MRTYHCEALDLTLDDPACWLNGPRGEDFECKARIRLFVLLMFRRYFGRPAASYWHKDGFMAEAFSEPDCRGRSVLVEQINRSMKPIALLPPHVEVAA